MYKLSQSANKYLSIPFGILLALADVANASPTGIPDKLIYKPTALSNSASFKMPLYFEPNQGQDKGDVKYLMHSKGYNLKLKANEAVLGLHAKSFTQQAVKPSGQIHMKLAGARQTPAISGQNRYLATATTWALSISTPIFPTTGKYSTKTSIPVLIWCITASKTPWNTI